MINRTKVMVVDGLTETEEVLKAVLEPRGMQVTRVRSDDRHESFHSSERPTVVVLHESDRSVSENTNITSRSLTWGEVPCVVIGRTPPPLHASNWARRYLPQPFQYAELVTAIESLAHPD